MELPNVPPVPNLSIPQLIPFSGVSLSGSDISTDGILVTFDSGVGLEVKAAQGAMSILVTIPDNFRGQTQGLLGTWNYNGQDDFTLPNGDVLASNLTTEELHYQFGLFCKSENTTIFLEIIVRERPVIGNSVKEALTNLNVKSVNLVLYQRYNCI